MCSKSSRNTPRLLSVLLGAFLIYSGSVWGAETTAGNTIPVRGEVTLVDLGADNCLPCRMMAPIIADLQKAYQGKATIVFVDVYRESVKAKQFHAMVIPTQIFYDRNSNEVYRHSGVMEKAEIVKQLDAMLAKKG